MDEIHYIYYICEVENYVKSSLRDIAKKFIEKQKKIDPNLELREDTNPNHRNLDPGLELMP